ncbi:hypothetical protein GCM10008968_32550 [Bacillus horti]
MERRERIFLLSQKNQPNLKPATMKAQKNKTNPRLIPSTIKTDDQNPFTPLSPFLITY